MEFLLQEATVLIIADDPEFTREVIARWQMERTVPLFTTMSSDLWSEAGNAASDMVVLGPRLESSVVARLLDSFSQPVICVNEHAQYLQSLREKSPRTLTVQQREGWLDTLVMLATEILRRVEAVHRAQLAEEICEKSQREAVLGRYMLEMRHSLNNALTSVLGNSELLLLEPGTLSSDVRDQIDTIRNMAVRMHEIIQRFSSLDSEMKIAMKNGQQTVSGETRVAASS
jgi:signal transduction histidine kinase